MKKDLEINKIIKREIVITLFLFILYLIWWYYFSYIYPPKNVKNYTFILGLPKWFFYAVIGGYIVFNILVIIIIKYVFCEIDLDKYEEIDE